MHHFVGADNSCISWGHAQNGELGYGPSGQKYVFYTYNNSFISLRLLSFIFSFYFYVSAFQVFSSTQKG